MGKRRSSIYKFMNSSNQAKIRMNTDNKKSNSFLKDTKTTQSIIFNIKDKVKTEGIDYR